MAARMFFGATPRRVIRFIVGSESHFEKLPNESGNPNNCGFQKRFQKGFQQKVSSFPLKPTLHRVNLCIEPGNGEASFWLRWLEAPGTKRGVQHKLGPVERLESVGALSSVSSIVRRLGEAETPKTVGQSWHLGRPTNFSHPKEAIETGSGRVAARIRTPAIWCFFLFAWFVENKGTPKKQKQQKGELILGKV